MNCSRQLPDMFVELRLDMSLISLGVFIASKVYVLQRFCYNRDAIVGMV